MLNKTWNDLHRRFDVPDGATRTIPDDGDPLSMVVVSKKLNGKTGTFTGFDGTKVVLRLDNGVTAALSYKSVKLIDEHGQPIEETNSDVLRQPVVVGSLICYSVATSYSHEFEIGRVTSISDIGNFTVRKLVSGGQPVPRGEAWRNTKDGIRPKNCLKIPVDEALLTMAVMTDFASIVGDGHE